METKLKVKSRYGDNMEKAMMSVYDNRWEWDLDWESCKILDDVYSSTYLWMKNMWGLIDKDPKKFIEEFISIGGKFFDVRAYRWIRAILIASEYHTSKYDIKYPSIAEMRRMRGLVESKPIDQVYILDRGKRVYLEKLDISISSSEDALFALVNKLMRRYVYSYRGAMNVNMDLDDFNEYVHIRRMRNVFRHSSKDMSYMTWAYALCMRYDIYNNRREKIRESQFPTKEEVIHRYHRLLNKKTNRLKSTRAFQVFYDDTHGNMGYCTLHAMY